MMQAVSLGSLASFSASYSSLPARPVSSDSSPELARSDFAPATPVQAVAAVNSAPSQSAEVEAQSSAKPNASERSTPDSDKTQAADKTQAETQTEAASKRDAHSQPISEAELRQIEKLSSRDREVRAHEQAHAAVGGRFAGAPSYSFKRGPDGRSYAVGGEVGIDTGAVKGDPLATLRKMEQVQRAALAPADPSAQDRRVAAQAATMAMRAQAELVQQQREARAQGLSGDSDQQGSSTREHHPSIALYRQLGSDQDSIGQLDVQA